MATIRVKSANILRRDTAENWTKENPVLRQGEEGYETDTGRRKVGDGASAWNNLSYTVDRSYNPYSSNAQSGNAVAEAVATERKRTDTTFTNALKGSKSGSSILIDDVSPVTHEMGVKVRGKNLLNNILASSQKGVDLTCYGDYCVLNGTCTESYNFMFQQANLQAGTYTLSTLKSNNIEYNSNPLIQLELHSIDDDSIIYFGLTNNNVLNQFITFTVDKEYILFLRIRIQQNITYDNYYIYPQLELGSTATNYTPYVDVTKVKLIKTNDDGTVSEEYTPNADGTVESVTSLYPSISLTTDTDGVLIDCEYNRDINKAFAQLQSEIISLQGNI